MLSGDAATAATGSAGRFTPGVKVLGGSHRESMPRHQAGTPELRSAANTSTRPGPEATAQTPSAGIDADPSRSGAGGLQVFPVKDHRHTVLPAPAAKTSTRFSAHEHALGEPWIPPRSVNVFMMRRQRQVPRLHLG
jgi:hypothetical protein